MSNSLERMDTLSLSFVLLSEMDLHSVDCHVMIISMLPVTRVTLITIGTTGYIWKRVVE